MKKIWRSLYHNFEEWVGACVFCMMFFVLVIQILSRQVFNSPLVWSEELSMMMFVYVALLGVSSCIKENGHVGIDLLDGKLSPFYRKIVNIIINLSVLVSIITFIFVGIQLTERKFVIEMVGLGISSSYLYGALPVISCLMLVRFIENLFRVKKAI